MDILQSGIVAGLIALVIGLKWRDFLLFCFDYQQAQASGLRTRWLHYGLLCMVSLTIVATLKAVGIILSISLLIAPGAVAVLITRRFHMALLVAVAVSALVSVSWRLCLVLSRQRACADHCGPVRGGVYRDVCGDQREGSSPGACDSRVMTCSPCCCQCRRKAVPSSKPAS